MADYFLRKSWRGSFHLSPGSSLSQQAADAHSVMLMRIEAAFVLRGDYHFHKLQQLILKLHQESEPDL
jgi:hypothetical protein